MTQLLMIRPHLSETSPSESATGCGPATREDAEGIAILLASAFPEMTWDADRVLRDLLDNREVTQTFVTRQGGHITGTASARRAPAFPQYGYIHWVGVHPEHRGQGNFEALMSGVLQNIADSGYPSAVLETDDDRLPAISAYLAIGFVPQYPTSDHMARWSRVFANLAQRRRFNRK